MKNIETEKKYRLTKEQCEQVLEDLKELKAEFKGERFEENILYGDEDLENRGAVLRVRKIDNETILTFKQFVTVSGGAKQHIEHETKVEKAEEIEKIIEYLGYQKGIVYEKRRKIWHFRDVEIALDELPFGLFMEIEGTLMKIAEVEMFLGADEFEVEEATYPYLTFKIGEKKGNLREARF